MMNVFVLEDDFAQQSRIESIVGSLMERHHIQTKKFEVFGKPDQLIRAVEEKGAHQLFFLDIEIRADDKKGLEVAQQIRDIDPFAIIVFVTTHSEYMPLAFRYQVSALDFIDKELAPTEFEARIETALLYANGKNSRTVAEDSFYLQVALCPGPSSLCGYSLYRNISSSPSGYSAYGEGSLRVYREFGRYFETRKKTAPVSSLLLGQPQ